MMAGWASVGRVHLCSLPPAHCLDCGCCQCTVRSRCHFHTWRSSLLLVLVADIVHASHDDNMPVHSDRLPALVSRVSCSCLIYAWADHNRTAAVTHVFSCRCAQKPAIALQPLRLQAWRHTGAKACVGAAQGLEGYKLVTDDIELQPAAQDQQHSSNPSIPARKSDLQSADSAGLQSSKRRKTDLQSAPSVGSEKGSRPARGQHAEQNGSENAARIAKRSFDMGRASRAGSAALEAHAAELGEAVMSHHQQQRSVSAQQQAEGGEGGPDGVQEGHSMPARLLRTCRLPGVPSLLTIKVGLQPRSGLTAPQHCCAGECITPALSLSQPAPGPMCCPSLKLCPSARPRCLCGMRMPRHASQLSADT